ncbi:MAG: hypothetical protein ACE10C_15180, partial [Candidatus Binatia bacterium]
EKEPQQISGSIVKRHVMDIPDNMGKVSPNGRFLSYVDWNPGNVGILDLETGDRKLVSSDASGSAFGDVSIWSPDGKELMYKWISEGGQEIRIYNTETGDTRVLFPSGSGEVPFPRKWSSDGNTVLAINERDNHITDAITLVNTETADTRVVTTLSENWHTFGMDLSPDEKHIVYESFRTGQRSNRNAPVALKLLPTDGSSQRTLVDNGLRNYAPAWDREGKNVLYLSLRDGNTELWAMGVDNGRPVGQPRLVYAGFEGETRPLGITDDGGYFYSRSIRENYVYEQGVAFETGKVHQNLHVISSVRYGDQRSGAISPSGDYLAFVSEKHGEALLVITHLASGDTKVHDMPFKQIQLPLWRALTWSSDNKFVLVPTLDNVSPADPVMLSVNVQDGSFVKLNFFEDLYTARSRYFKGNGYSPDGKSIIFATPKHLVEMDIASKSHRVIYEFADREMTAMSLSPDGKTAAVSVGPGSPSNSESETIELLSIADGSVSKVDEATTELGYSRWVGISWSPDGQHLVFAENRPQGQQLYTLHLESGKRTALGEAVFGGDQYGGVQVHPDGDKVTFWRPTSQMQLWVLEGIEL